jgi:tryptophan synthase alpha chain
MAFGSRVLSRLSTRFSELKAKGEKALVCFVTAGDPSAEATVEIVKTLAKAGADAVEIGIPFSDPLADGPSIQAASQRALENGMTTAKTLDIVRKIREEITDLPLILMTYYNPIRCYGLESYAKAAAEAGADAHIVTDLTPEESEEWKRCSQANGLDTVYLVAPTSTAERIQVVAEISSGFVYCVSRTGVTGAKADVPDELTEVVARIKSHTAEPVCVGFGVSRPEHVSKISAFAEGVVVGSSLVDLIHRERENPNLQQLIFEYVSGLKAATRA